MRVSQGFWGTREHWQNIEGNKGTLANIWEQGTKFRNITVRKKSERVWEHGNIGQFWKGTRTPPPPGRSSLVRLEQNDLEIKRKDNTSRLFRSLVLTSRVFLRVLRSSSLQKTKISKFQFYLNIMEERLATPRVYFFLSFIFLVSISKLNHLCF